MSLSDTIKELVVNDYFTPNIKAEVILDTLLTQYIEKIVESQMGAQVGRLTFLTKEMSIVEKGKTDNRGTKIDYVLEDERGFVYLVELKTTSGSISGDQIERYIDNCCGKTFGESLGDKLLCLVREKFPKASDKLKNLTALQERRKGCADRARNYLKESKRASTNKYIYTLGQLLDHHDGDLETLWKAPMRLIYLTPDGKNVFPGSPRRKNKQDQEKAERQWKERKQEWDQFYLGPKGVNSSVSLVKAEKNLRCMEEEYAQLLADIIAAIYLPEMEEQ